MGAMGGVGTLGGMGSLGSIAASLSSPSDSPYSDFDCDIDLVAIECCSITETDNDHNSNKSLPESLPESDNSLKDNPTATYFFCKWKNCDWPGPGPNDDLVDHIREIHVELQPYQRHKWDKDKSSPTNESIPANDPLPQNKQKTCDPKKCESQQYVCLWEGCKVYGKASLSRSWLERHVLQHSGPSPFKCIVEACGARFKSQSSLERHINSHFKPNIEISSHSSSSTSGDINVNCNGMSPYELHLHQSSRATMMRVKCLDANQVVVNGSTGNMIAGTPNKILKRKKSATKLRKRLIVVKGSDDFFDECIMEQVRYGLVEINAHIGLDFCGSQSNITFTSTIIAQRKNDNGEVNVLLRWEPVDILPDIWVLESEVNSLLTKTIPISSLPSDTLAQLMGIQEAEKPKKKQSRK